jgi:hypothetical protein
MYLRYPVRNFRCPFCGAKMPTEEYKGWKPWTCPGCSQDLQFSRTHGCLVQLCFLGVALIILYFLGLRGWELFVGALLGGGVLAVVFIGPLDRVIPRGLEPYRPAEWTRWRSRSAKGKSALDLFPDEDVEADNSKSDRPRNNR